MEIKQVQLIPKGMNQDLSISKFNPEFSYENYNIRVTAREGDTLLTIENERGNSLIGLSTELLGTCIGHSILNEYVVIFTTSSINNTNVDRIYLINNLLENAEVTLLFTGNLAFDVNFPLDTFSLFETNNIQKVYWVDGKNQPRIINIVGDKSRWVGNNTAFDFAPTYAFNETITIKQSPIGGVFHSGIIQYAFSAFNIFGAETSIFKASELYFLGDSDRALTPEEISYNSFNITIENFDPTFDYTRVYSIHRTSWNAMPTVRIVGDFKKSADNKIICVDSGTSGTDVDPSFLLYLGGDDIILGSITTKDNTLFGANLHLNRVSNLQELLPNIGTSLVNNFSWTYRNEPVVIEDKEASQSELYTYKLASLLNPKGYLCHFKRGQYYRFAIQAQHKTGKWSEPLYIGSDIKCTLPFITDADTNTGQTRVALNQGNLNIPSNVLVSLYNAGYRKIRPLMVYPELNDRIILAQGVITNTLAFNHQRDVNQPFGFTDYAFRPSWLGKHPLFSNNPELESGTNLPRVLNIGHLLTTNLELECGQVKTDGNYVVDRIQPNHSDTPIDRPYQLFMDENLINFYSPDIEYNESVKSLLSSNLICQFIGVAHINSTYSVRKHLVEGDSAKGYSAFTRANFDTFPLSIIKRKTGAEQYELYRFWRPNPVYKTPEGKLALKYNNGSSKIYSLFNTIFDDRTDGNWAVLSFEINKPLYCNRNDDFSIIPCTTNKIDKGGVVNYGKQADFTLAHSYNETPANITSTRMAYKGNSHVAFSYKDLTNISEYIRDPNLPPKVSRVTPTFTLADINTSANPTNPYLPDPESDPSNPTPVYTIATVWTLYDANDKYYLNSNGDYIAKAQIRIVLDNFENMSDDDMLLINPRLNVKRRIIWNFNQTEDFLFYEVTAPNITILTKNDYLNLPPALFDDGSPMGGRIFSFEMNLTTAISDNNAGAGFPLTIHEVVNFNVALPKIEAIPNIKFIIQGNYQNLNNTPYQENPENLPISIIFGNTYMEGDETDHYIAPNGDYIARSYLRVLVEGLDRMVDTDAIHIYPRITRFKRIVWDDSQMEDSTWHEITEVVPIVLTKTDYINLPLLYAADGTPAGGKKLSFEVNLTQLIPDEDTSHLFPFTVHEITKFFPLPPNANALPGERFWLYGTQNFQANLPSNQVNLMIADKYNFAHNIVGTLPAGIATTNVQKYTYQTVPYYRKNTNDPGFGYQKEFININQFKLQNTPINNGTDRQLFYVPLAELKRPITTELLDKLYGGKTSETLNNHLWIPCGESVKINSINASLNLTFTDGDTYIRRYDCLKTAPLTEEEENKFSSALSFLCETYVNLDGRSDRNRYTPDLTYSRFTNYGLLNPVYSQSNNYFNYRILDPRLFNVNQFKNQITWSQPKHAGELVDSWSSINLASNLDLDGTLGPINAIRNFNGNLFTFQDRGIAAILFNSRVQIPTSDGVPIEISNSLKVDGYRYISNQKGCLNKQSIAISKKGIYFVDSLNKSINRLSEGIEDISIQGGFKAWSNNNLANNTVKLHADLINDDVYFTSDTFCLGYSELLENFTSFYSYEGIPYMFNAYSKFLAIKNTSDKVQIYQQNSGKFNSFFGTMRASSIQYKINPEIHRDKIFNNIEYRADCFDIDGNLLPNRTFDTIRVWNEHQDTNIQLLLPNRNIIRKFRAWRGALPRQFGSLDRIRNPWINLKLTLLPCNQENIKLHLHDIIVSYTL